MFDRWKAEIVRDKQQKANDLAARARMPREKTEIELLLQNLITQRQVFEKNLKDSGIDIRTIDFEIDELYCYGIDEGNIVHTDKYAWNFVRKDQILSNCERIGFYHDHTVIHAAYHTEHKAKYFKSKDMCQAFVVRYKDRSANIIVAAKTNNGHLNACISLLVEAGIETRDFEFRRSSHNFIDVFVSNPLFGAVVSIPVIFVLLIILAFA